MTKSHPPQFKSKAALLEWMLSRADDLAAVLRRGTSGKPSHNPEIDLRLSMATLLQCADFVFQVSEAGELATAKPHSGSTPEYVQLDIGHLRTKGYLAASREEGLLSLWRRKLLLPFRVEESGDGFRMLIGTPGQEQELLIAATLPSFGGRRFWFVCPGLEAECGSRFLRLYRDLNGGPFACRNCHKAAHDNGWRSARDRKVLPSTIQRAS